MTEELLDILDSKGNKTGESRTYIDAHKYGLTHRAVHVYIINDKNELLLQKRSPKMRAYPNYWDVSASGHVSAGETSLDAAKKETSEELNLELGDDNFVFLFTCEERKILNNNTFINNEFQDVYLVRIKDKKSVNFDPNEVAGVKWINLADFKKMIDDEQSMLVPHKEEYELVLDYVNMSM